MVEILDQTTAKSAIKIGSKLPQLCFTAHIHGFCCENSLRYEDSKNSKAYGGNLQSGLEKGLQLLYIPLIRYIQDFYCESELMWRS